MSVKRNFVVLFAGIQWLTFMFTNTVVIPLSIGMAFHQSAEVISGSMSRAFMFTGIACLLQAFIGHRLPLMEGQSGLWWGVILSLCTLGSAAGVPLSVTGGSLAVGMVAGGILIMLCGILGLHRLLNRLFTPIVMAVLLILLAAQLIDIFFQGMVGLQGNGHLELGIAGLSLFLVVLVSILTIAGKGLLSNFSILIGIVIGWPMYEWLFAPKTPQTIPSWHEIIHIFSWGNPSFNIGIIIAGIVTGLINTTNTIATLRASENLFGHPVSDGRFRRSFVLTGLFTSVSGALGLVAYAPYTSSIAFLRTTRILTRAPFILGAGLFVVLGLVPDWSGFFATMPISVGEAVLFVAYLQLFGAALRNIEGVTFTFRTVFRIALPTLTGLAIQSTPADAFSSLPGFSQAIASNGMLVGILISVILENTVPWQRLERELPSS